jgi:hypothetical protein
MALLRGTRWGDVERAMDRIDRRFGRDSAFPAVLLPTDDASPSARTRSRPSTD